MDEIAAVKSFRSAFPERDAAARANVRRVLDGAMWTPTPEPRRRLRSFLVVAAAALVAVIAVSSAFGWTARLIDLVAGEPAPEPVKAAFAIHNDAFARQAIPIFRSGTASEAIVEQAHGVLGIDSSAGPVFIWAAPTKGGGLCYVLDVERERLPNGRPSGGGGCSPNKRVPRAVLSGGMRVRSLDDGSYLSLIQGQVGPEVAKVELRYADGSTDELPVFEGFFLTEPRAGAKPEWLVALGADGEELARRQVRDPRTAIPRMPEPTGRERVLFDFETAAGYRLTFSIAPGEDGTLCQITRYRGGTGRGCNPDPRDGMAPDALAIHPGLQNEAGDAKALVTLSGAVGSEVATLELRYEDGTTDAVPIVEQFVMFEIPPAHHGDRRFTLVGRDHAGDEIARLRIS